MKIKPIFLYILIFLLAFSLRFYAVQHKTFIQHDEPFSFISSSPSTEFADGTRVKENWETFNFEKGKDYKVYDLKKSLYCADYKSAIKDILLTRNHNIDHQHPTLYYSILRIWDMGLDGVDSFKCIKRGCYLNILLFALEFFFMFKLLSLIKPDDTKFISIGLFFAFCSTAGISNTLLVREYALAELFFVISTYLGIYICKIIAENKPLISKHIYGFSFCFALLALTGYFQIIYDGIIAFVLLGFCLYYKRFGLLVKTLYMIILAFVWLLVIYPDYFYYMFHNEWSDSTSLQINISYVNQGFQTFIKKFCNYFVIYKNIIQLILFFAVLGKTVFEPVFSKNLLPKNTVKTLLFILILVTFWTVITISFSPLGYLRFALPASAVFGLFYALTVYNFRKPVVLIICTAFFILSAMPLFNKNFENTKIAYMYDNPEEEIDTIPQDKMEFLENENILKTVDGRYNFKFTAKLPMIIINPEQYYPYFYFTLFDNDGIVRFEDKLPDENFKYNEFILFSPEFNELKYYKNTLTLIYDSNHKNGIYYVIMK